jgi:hypothetical protein
VRGGRGAGWMVHQQTDSGSRVWAETRTRRMNRPHTGAPRRQGTKLPRTKGERGGAGKQKTKVTDFQNPVPRFLVTGGCVRSCVMMCGTRIGPSVAVVAPGLTFRAPARSVVRVTSDQGFLPCSSTSPRGRGLVDGWLGRSAISHCGQHYNCRPTSPTREAPQPLTRSQRACPLPLCH